MGKAQSWPIAGVASRRTRVLAAFALFAVSAVLLAGAGHHWDAGAQESGGFWMEFDRNLYDGNQTIRLFGSVGNARIDNPTVTIQVTNEITKNTFSEQVYVDRAGGFELVIPSLSDALYNATVTHESAGSISTTFTIGQPPPEAVLEEAPQEPVPETEDVPPPKTEDIVPPVQETSPRAPMTEVETVLHCTAEGLNFIMSGFVLDGDVEPVCIILQAAFITLLIILALWSVNRRHRRKRQTGHKGAMPSGWDGPDSETPQSGHHIGAPPLSKFVGEVAPIRKRKPAVKATALTASELREWEVVRQGMREARRAATVAKLKGKYIVFDTNICINYMCVRFSQDMEMSPKAREMFNSRGGDMEPDIPDCVDIALDEGRICLPTKTTTEFHGRIQELIDDKEIEWADRPKLKKSTLLDILLGGRKKDTHNVTIKGFRGSDLDTVKGMYDEFAADTSPRMVRNMNKMYDKLIGNANGDKTEIARIKKMKEDKKSPLGDGDAKILATALTLSAELKPLCLITMDGDMLRVARDIKDRIGIEIIGGYKR